MCLDEGTKTGAQLHKGVGVVQPGGGTGETLFLSTTT